MRIQIQISLLADVYHPFQSFCRCFSVNSPSVCDFCCQSGWEHKQICNFSCLITSVLPVCIGHNLTNAVAAHWLGEKCQRLLVTALKVQHGWTLKTIVGGCWRQSPTRAVDSRQLKYKHKRDCRRLSASRATVNDFWRLKYKAGSTDITVMWVWIICDLYEFGVLTVYSTYLTQLKYWIKIFPSLQYYSN